jgi:hypothetical protein
MRLESLCDRLRSWRLSAMATTNSFQMHATRVLGERDTWEVWYDNAVVYRSGYMECVDWMDLVEHVPDILSDALKEARHRALADCVGGNLR